ncbi:MAG: 16S rRNA (cytidine(1402)-2'-O)-methyltransferase [bacterium]|nr:16S rRNA (cytidine(1402)-2'-O)-methyltransferase [bacterium]
MNKGLIIEGRLSIVATPIGNLEDITLRALRTFKECDVIYAEDTRVISKLLSRYEIKKPLQRLDAATELKKAEEILARMEAGEHVVFVSDAGTPGISDPGARLVRHIRTSAKGGSASGGNGSEIKIEAIPGPSALTTALSIAGIDATEFTFLGFLPHKKGRQTAIKRMVASEIPVVLYESPHRILKLMKELSAAAPECRVTVARELTKIYEEIIAGTPQELIEQLESKKSARGEFVVIISQ